MSEQEFAEALRDLTRDEPPLSVDPDELIARARHARHRRWSLVGATLATALVAVTAVGVVVGNRLGPPGPATQAAAPVLATSTTPASPPAAATSSPASATTTFPSFASITRVTSSLPELRARGVGLSAHLTQVFPTVVRDSTVISVGPWDNRVGAETPDNGGDTAARLVGLLRFSDAVGPTAVAVEISAPGWASWEDEGDCGGIGTDARCVSIGPLDDGGVLSVAESEFDGGRPHRRTVALVRTDGSGVRISAFDYDPGGDPAAATTADGLSRNEPLRAEVALTTDQLIALVTDPGLVL
ncbi:hypothetical protein [Goodfellowiella coeruleoviolacea]|uniref:hypothetical protein n=1 Tax=Goodfellowiella coeruleoviolacea TaxID=334858 RepID=UPI0020A5E8E3|nr:hypothetical protein [Goodfellowiella coeruleoviolacea]